jgi:hypothetical protein
MTKQKLKRLVNLKTPEIVKHWQKSQKVVNQWNNLKLAKQQKLKLVK